MAKFLTPEQFLANRGETFLDYSSITNVDLANLRNHLQVEIALATAAGETTTSTMTLCDHVRVDYYDNLLLKAAFFRVDSHYFEDREAISLNADGFIGIAGWSDSKNELPFKRALEKWAHEIVLKTR